MKKRDIFFISFVIFIVAIAIFLSTFLNLSPNHELINIFEEWWPENYERISEVKIKIDGEMRKGIVFVDETGFFDARAICLSRNMSLPHQGFEILFSELEHDEINDAMFWIDAYQDQNGSIFSSAIGHDQKIINDLLEKSIQGSRMLSKKAQIKLIFLKDLEYLLSSDCCYVVDENYKLPGYFFRESNFKQGIGFSITKTIFIREKSVNPKSKKDGQINVFYQYGLPMFPDVIKLNKSFLQEFYPYKSIRIIVSDPCSKLSLFLWS